jgi:dipeptidyl-peptidase 4
MHLRAPGFRTSILIVFLAAAALGHAQQPTPALAVDVQIDRIFRDHVYQAPRFGPARWLPDGTAYAVVEWPAGGGSEIDKYDALSGARTVLVPSSRLVPHGFDSPLEIDDYAWSADGRRLLIFTNTRKVWRQNTRGDYWVLDVATGALTKVDKAAPSSSLMFAKFSPDGSRVAYVRDNNIYVQQLDSAKIDQLTRDGSDPASAAADGGVIVNGTSDWVYEEELNVRDGFRWSPDGRRIAYWQFDTHGVGIFSLIDDTSATYPIVKKIPYPKAGTRNSSTRIGVVGVDDGQTRWMRTPEDPRNSYLATLEWIDQTTVAMQQLNRLQNRNDYLLGDVTTGDVRRVFRDESQTWVDVQDEIPWIDHGRWFLWTSERDGWRHVYRIAKDGGDPRLITTFDADVIEVVGTSAADLYVLASPSNATQRYLYRAPLDGSRPPQRVTPEAESGTHAYDLAPGGRLAFHTWSSFDRPPAMDVVDLPDHRSRRALTDPSTLKATLADVLRPPAEFFTIDIGGGVTLDGLMLKPRSFNPSRKYPVIVHVYGEPAGQTVTDAWGGAGALFHRALADAGYIIVSFDNRGTPAPKGAPWRKAIYGSVGDLSSKEQAAAIRALAVRKPYIDSTRIGIWGWSGGGSSTLNAMFRFPDVYAVGVAVAPVPDQRLYDTIYQERYMGLPEENAAGYKIGSPINFADGLKGKLLIVHGSGDDNVHYQGTERLINRLVELGKPFDVMVYPNRTHAIAEGPGTTPHVYHLIARYFLEHLRPGPL